MRGFFRVRRIPHLVVGGKNDRSGRFFTRLVRILSHFHKRKNSECLKKHSLFYGWSERIFSRAAYPHLVVGGKNDRSGRFFTRLFESSHIFTKEKMRMLKNIRIFMVGVRGFEPPASWSRTKHSTKLSHTPKTRFI